MTDFSTAEAAVIRTASGDFPRALRRYQAEFED